MRSALTLVVFLVFCHSVASAEDLPLDEVAEGHVSGSEPAIFTFTSERAGALTIVVRCEGNGGDVGIAVTDSIGQTIAGGQIDNNYQQNFGAEQGVVPIPRAGEYQVRVDTYGGRTAFVISAAWLPFDALAQPEDPDGSPLTAIELEFDEWYEEDIYNSQSDMADWFKVVAPGEGEVIVRTQGNEGDLVLEAYREGEYNDFFQRSDSDLDNNTAKESILVDMEEGEVVYFKVTAYGGDNDYEIRATFAE